MIFFKLFGALQSSVQGAIFDISKEQKAFLSSGGKCPSCECQITTAWSPKYVNMFSSDGVQIPIWKIWKQNVFSISYFKCLKCGYEWNQRNTNNPVVVAPKLRVVGFFETDRTQESLGDESRVIDNYRSPSAMTRKFTISREWNKGYVIEYEKSDANKHEIAIGASEAVNIKAVTENALREQYSVSEGRKESASEEVEITVPANTKLCIIFQWKRIWQNGVIKLTDEKEQEFTVPYRIAVGITFDQLQYDVNANKDSRQKNM